MPGIRLYDGIAFTMPLNHQNKNNAHLTTIAHKAGWVLIDPWNILRDGFVKVESGKIVDVGQGRGGDDADQVIDHGPGVLMPALVNAHTHLELSGLKGQTVIGKGFIQWVKSVIEKREQLNEKIIIDAVSQGISDLAKSGALIAGEVSSMGLSRNLFFNSNLSGVWFKEYLGNGSEDLMECKKLNFSKIVSVAGHGPHTTSGKLLVQLKSAANKGRVPFTIHLAESEEEFQFLTTAKGPWADFLSQRGIDLFPWQLPGDNPVQYADKAGLLDKNTLAVHLVFADKKDIQSLADKKVNICLCPKSNLILHNRLPDVSTMIKKGIKPSIGTDSLASNDSLSIFDEMKFIANFFTDIPFPQILAMATINGANALGLEKQFGALEPGKIAKMIYLPVETDKRNVLIESIITSDFSGRVLSVFENQ